MSDYPPTPSYGANYGAQGNPPYLPPTYPNQYLQEDGRAGQGHIASNYDASMAAYGYNRNVSAFGAAAVATGVPPLPIYQGWNQDAIPLPPYTTLHNGPQYGSYTDNSLQNNQYYQPLVSQPNFQQNLHAVKHYESNDLSEGEFEDGAIATNTPPVGYHPGHYGGNDVTGYHDTAQRAIYSRTQDYSPQQSYPANNYNYPSRDPPQLRRQQSDSYSPFVSPPGGADDEQAKGNQQYNTYSSHSQQPTNGTPHAQYGWAQNGLSNPSKSISHTNGYHTPQRDEQTSQPATLPSALPAQPAPSHAATVTNGKSVAESRKKAQAAILNLWPYDVRYQTYIDEGFKEDIVARLFDDLQMSKSVNNSQPNAEGQSVAKSQLLNGKASLVSTTSTSSPAAGVAPALGNRLENQDGALTSVSRTSQQGTATVPRLAQTTTSSSATTAAVSAQPKSTAMTDKERTLQSKMEALRKSREERAQKAAAKAVAKPSTAPLPALEKELPDPAPENEASNSLSKSPPAPKSLLPVSSNTPPSLPNPPFSMAQQQPPIIPGLFLASTAAQASSTSSQGILSAPIVNQRKRPVAADFDDVVSSMTPFKRPFGHSRDERRLVIDVSDDELDSGDEDVAMDLESQADQDSPVQSARKMSDPRAAALQNLPPLTNFPARTPFTPPPKYSANSTPSISQSTAKSFLGRPEDLQQKESEIEKLKKKIAEAEARKKARQTPSGTRTPQATSSSAPDGSDTTVTNGSLASNVEASMQMQNLISIADNQVALDQQKLADAQAAEVEKQAEVKRNQAEENRLRREKLASELPKVEAETQQNQTKLEQLRAEMARIEAVVQKNLEEKQKLADEMARLGQEAEDQLQAQREKLKDLTTQEARTSADGPSLPSSSTVVDDDATRHSQPPIANDLPLRSSPSDLNKVPDVSAIDVVVVEPPVTGLNDNSAPHVNNEVPESEIETSTQEVSEAGPGTSKDIVSNDQALEAALQEAVRAEADSHTDGEDDMDIEVSYAPNPNQLAPASPSNPAEEDSRSSAYSPTLDRTMPDAPDRESDDYEPPDATPPDEGPPPIESPPFSPAPPEDIAEPEDDNMPDFDVTQVNDEDSHNGTGELSLVRRGSPPRVVEREVEDLNKTPLFTPYESPLKRFRAYRFHPDFKQDIPGGLRSRTYSHKINPAEEFCRYELAGGICNDSTCDLQHFRDIGLPDDAILTALGSPDEFKGEQRDKFCEGLKAVLMDLRVRKIRDFDIIASEIIAHRSKFLGDNSKVLALEDTTL